MKDDTISRSALVAELECFKVACGDVVIRVIVDRVIEIVKAHKAEEEAPPAAPEPVSRTCYTCRHVVKPASKHPCRTCGSHKNWEALP